MGVEGRPVSCLGRGGPSAVSGGEARQLSREVGLIFAPQNPENLEQQYHPSAPSCLPCHMAVGRPNLLHLTN